MYKEGRVRQSLKWATLGSDKKNSDKNCQQPQLSLTDDCRLYTQCFMLQSEVSVLGPSSTKGPSQGYQKGPGRNLMHLHKLRRHESIHPNAVQSQQGAGTPPLLQNLPLQWEPTVIFASIAFKDKSSFDEDDTNKG